MNVKVFINRSPEKEILLGGKWYPTKTPIDMDIVDALQYGRQFPIDIPQMDIPQYDPKLWKKKIFGFTGDADASSGFGNCTVNLLKYSVRDGYDVRWIGRNNNVRELFRINRKDFSDGLGMVYHEQPQTSWQTAPFSRKIAIVPFETTRVPYSWVKSLNSLDGLLTMSDQNIQMFRDSDVKVPIEKIKWGIDENKLSYIERNNQTFTFGSMGALSERKGTDLLVKAFVKTFPQHMFPNVRLILKTSYNVFTWGVKNDKRIEVQMTPVEHDELKERFWKRVDCFVFPSRGEGFGLTPLEALATGIPAIVTNWGGLAEFATKDTCLLLDNYKIVPAKVFSEKVYKEECGSWCEPDLDELCEKMLYAYFHQSEMKEMGRRGAEYVVKNWLWKDVINVFHEKLGMFL